MYASFFGWSRMPFISAYDPALVFMSDQHQEALAHLLYGVRSGGGFLLLTGEIGAGKTTVVRSFLQQLPKPCVVACVGTPCQDALHLLQTACARFHLPPFTPQGSVKAHMDALNAFLLSAHAKGQQAMLIVDDAHALAPALLEQLRLLTNLETPERKLLQIVLVGRPELRARLAGPGMEQLAQRVVARYHLCGLSDQGTRDYVKHRLAVAGPRAPVPFDTAALGCLHRLSCGLPRTINVLADRALLNAHARGQRVVRADSVDDAADAIFPSRQRRRQRVARWGMALLSLAMVIGGLCLVFKPLLSGHDGQPSHDKIQRGTELGGASHPTQFDG